MMTNSTSTHTPFYLADPVDWQTVQTWLFAPLLPWQQGQWQYFTEHFPKLPHAILFAGSAGTGKRAFTYRLVAWLLCENKLLDHNSQNPSVACGHCASCQWLKSNTHPNLLTVPTIVGPEIENNEKTDAKKSAKKPTLTDTSPTHHNTQSIKIDDIRAMTEFVQTRAEGVKIVVVHQAESMTLGASNALLKTLEEPADNVLILLLSDTPSRLLPTIRSRLQQFNVSKMTAEQSLAFMQAQLANTNQYTMQHLAQANTISGFAPFVAMDMLVSAWYQQRQTWLNSWQAIRAGQRTVVQASDFWQKQLSLSDFLFLSQLMLADIISLSMQLSPNQTDIDWQKLQPLPPILALYALQQTMTQIEQDRRQNIQEKLCYDKLLGQMSQI